MSIPQIPQIIGILLHVPDWESATDWYALAFPQAQRHDPPTHDWGQLQIGSVELAIVNADDKVACGPAGSVIYWGVADIEAEIARFVTLGATLYRGPMRIGPRQWMAQVQDPWGNCIGLRQN